MAAAAGDCLYFIFIIYSVFVLCLLAEASIGIAPIRLCPEITTDAKFILRSLKTRLIKKSMVLVT